MSAAPVDTVVACPSCQQHMFCKAPEVPATAEKVVANPKTVTEIKAILPHLSDFAIAKALHEHRQVKAATVASLLGGSRNFTGTGWAAYQVTTNDVDGHRIVPQDEAFKTAPTTVSEQEIAIQRSMGFDNSLGIWNVDTHIAASTADTNIIAPSRVTDDITPYTISGVPKMKEGFVSFITRKESAPHLEETPEEQAIRERIEANQRLRNMGFDDSFGRWDAGDKPGIKHH